MKPAYRMNTNGEMMEVRKASPATTVLRQSRMNSSTVNATNRAPSHMCSCKVSSEARMKRD